jgi:hypothetical protein
MLNITINCHWVKKDILNKNMLFVTHLLLLHSFVQKSCGVHLTQGEAGAVQRGRTVPLN